MLSFFILNGFIALLLVKTEMLRNYFKKFTYFLGEREFVIAVSEERARQSRTMPFGCG